jgi:hypothetical protein
MTKETFILFTMPIHSSKIQTRLYCFFFKPCQRQAVVYLMQETKYTLHTGELLSLIGIRLLVLASDDV